MSTMNTDDMRQHFEPDGSPRRPDDDEVNLELLRNELARVNGEMTELRAHLAAGKPATAHAAGKSETTLAAPILGKDFGAVVLESDETRAGNWDKGHWVPNTKSNITV